MSQQFDASAKLFMKWGAEDWLALAGVKAPGKTLEIDSDVSSVTARVDKILLVDLPTPYIEHLEIQSHHDPDIPIRLCRYGAIIHYQQRLPVRSSVILLSPSAESPKLNGVYEVNEPDGALTMQYHYRAIRLWEIPAMQLCEAGIGVLGLAPLGKMKPDELPAVIKRMRIRAQTELKPTEQKEFWAATGLLMGLRHPSQIIKEFLMSPVYLEDSSIGRMWIEQGIEKGIEQGRREEAAKTLLRLLRFRFGTVAIELQKNIESLTDLPLLEDLQILAIQASEIDVVTAEINRHRAASVDRA